MAPGRRGAPPLGPGPADPQEGLGLPIVGVPLRRRAPLARRTLGEIRRFLRRLRAFDAQVVVDLMGNHKAGVLAFLARGRRRIGAPRRDRREPSSVCWINETVQLQRLPS